MTSEHIVVIGTKTSNDPAEKNRFSRRCFNFPVHAADAVGANGDSPSSFLENFAPCISGFLSLSADRQAGSDF